MRTISLVITDQIKEVKGRFCDECGQTIEELGEAAFIQWYAVNFQAPKNVIIYDLSEYYVSSTEEEIKVILSNTNKP